MFTAMVMACVMHVQDACVVAEDSRGPYQTQEVCVVRAKEMIEELATMLPLPHTYKYKCVKDKDGISL